MLCMYGMVWYGMLGLVCEAMVSHGRCDIVWFGVVWFRLARFGNVWYSMV